MSKRGSKIHSWAWWKWFMTAPLMVSYLKNGKGRWKDNYRIAEQRWLEREPKK